MLSEFQKIVLQFVLLTVAGTFISTFLRNMRDNEDIRQSILSTTRDIISRLDDLYRSTKQIKRSIRSRLKTIPEESEEICDAEIDGAYFLEQMDLLSKTQLQLEQYCQMIRVRVDLFHDDRRRKKILNWIRYSEKYLRDVLVEFERRMVAFDGEQYKITKRCTYLNDFLGKRWHPPEFDADFVIMESDEASDERYEAFKRIVKQEPPEGSPDYRRYKSISDACLLLAIREMREAALESKPALDLNGFLRGIWARMRARKMNSPLDGPRASPN